MFGIEKKEICGYETLFREWGYFLTFRENFEPGLEQFNTAVTKVPNDKRALLGRALTRAKLCHYAEALEDINKADKLAGEEIDLTIKAQKALITYLSCEFEEAMVMNLRLIPLRKKPDHFVMGAMHVSAGGKKNRQKERRLMKGFNIGPQPSPSTGPLPPVAEFIASLQNHHNHEGHNHNDIFGSTLSGIFNQTPRRMQQQSTVSSSQGSINEGPTYHIHHHNHHRISSKHDWFNMKRSSSHKRRWGTIIEAAKTGKVSRLIGRSRSEDSVCNSNCQENGHHHHSRSHSNSPASDDNGSSASDSNPSLDNAERPVHGEHQEHHNHHSIVSGLALLKKKRKKFSASRNTSPVVIPPNEAAIEQAVAVCIGKNNKK
ncbi:transient receptor potential-gamma protein-like, partial [Agrilus planipennis]|uniref:Transient receptor potential-gamma protein-like n=1 Tax=Agrilus planipennis TaxID=224129 RepID=A0A1W4XQN3_AGRPL